MGKPGLRGRHDLGRVPDPVGGYPSLPTSKHNRADEVVAVAVVDLYDERRRIRALARIDLLDVERRNGDLDEAAYLAGREVERVFEVMRTVGGGGQWQEGDRVDAAVAHELALLAGLERARTVNEFLAWLVRQLGPMDTRLLWLVLGERLSLRTAAVAFGRLGRRGYRVTVDRFREALFCLAEAKAAKGKGHRSILGWGG